MQPLRSSRRRPSRPRLEGDRESRAIATRLGGELRDGRRGTKLKQAQVAALIGVHQSRVSQIERGFGHAAPLAVWIAFGIAVQRPLAISASRSLISEPRDAGHLAAQELILQLGKANGIKGTFELPARAAPGATYIDVGLRDDRRRVLSVIEVWNRFEDIGAGSRNFKRKLAEAEALAVAAGGDGDPYRVAGCWVLRATAANRALVARYPAIFAAEFPGSSRAWLRSLLAGDTPPDEPGVVWVDVGATRLTEVRFRT
jgi:transcriptional regulator with XRE-family HTH domain